MSLKSTIKLHRRRISPQSAQNNFNGDVFSIFFRNVFSHCEIPERFGVQRDGTGEKVNFDMLIITLANFHTSNFNLSGVTARFGEEQCKLESKNNKNLITILFRSTNQMFFTCTELSKQQSWSCSMAATGFLDLDNIQASSPLSVP